MTRTIHRGFWTTRRRLLAACIALLGAILVTVLVDAQKPGDQNEVTIERRAINAHLSLLPGTRDSELKLRVQTNRPGKSPPKVEIQDMAGGIAREVKVEGGPVGTNWLVTITKVRRFGVGYLCVTTTGNDGVVERHQVRFATRGVAKHQSNVIYSVEGRFAFVIPPGDMPDDTRFLVSTLDAPNLALAEGVTVEAGPYEILAMGQVPNLSKASVSIRLGKRSLNASPGRGYRLRWRKPGSAVWEVLPVTIGIDGGEVHAAVTGPGMFVLTSEDK